MLLISFMLQFHSEWQVTSFCLFVCFLFGYVNKKTSEKQWKQNTHTNISYKLNIARNFNNTIQWWQHTDTKADKTRIAY